MNCGNADFNKRIHLTLDFFKPKLQQKIDQFENKELMVFGAAGALIPFCIFTLTQSEPVHRAIYLSAAISAITMLATKYVETPLSRYLH